MATMSLSPLHAPLPHHDALATLVRDEQERERRSARRALERHAVRALAEQRRQARRAREEARRSRQRAWAGFTLLVAALVSLFGLLLHACPDAPCRSALLEQGPAGSAAN